jgi:hypothetical protein
VILYRRTCFCVPLEERHQRDLVTEHTMALLSADLTASNVLSDRKSSVASTAN